MHHYDYEEMLDLTSSAESRLFCCISFTGRCHCDCAPVAHFLHQQYFSVCWNLFVWTFPQQYLPLYACLY